MAASTLAQTESFLREQYSEAIEGRLPLAPTFKAILNTLLTVTAADVGQDEVRATGAIDGNRFVVRLALGVLADRYSRGEVVMLILSLDQ